MMKLSEAAKIVNADLTGEDTVFENVSTDTRTIQPGSLFIALRGPNFDANDFIAKAEEQGAVGAVVNRVVKTTLPLICVSDTLEALGRLARYQREQIPIPAIVVTGSCGKTTTRALLASVFRQCGNVLASEKSFNNNIGVPLTLLRLRPDHHYALLELGANHPGEITYLTGLAKPSVAIITNAGPVHLEGFGSLEGVAKAKGEIFEGLSSDGTAVINNDDHFAEFWRRLAHSRRIISFGINQPADVMAKNITLNSDGRPAFQLVLPTGQLEIQLPLIGVHNVANALAAAAAAYAQQLSTDAIKAGLESVVSVKGRLVEQKGYRGAIIIDDSYNANPLSVSAAIAVLAKRPGHSVLVLGDMLELGQGAEQFHQEIGKRAFEAGVKQLYCYGTLTKHTANAFGKNARHFDNQEKLLTALKNDLNANAVVLVKGSLSMRMGNIAHALLEE
ncbi:UDP-N-acetylmuramoyl-tripeptide--D-alanyl-D-alanine ligase [Coxiella burnetii]|uniref:UDP-N-acetylmuramoyl-tripeptide--D-alanyl-D- alanine ligase n=1 Tax=Coxiella burnetii TaxID=777 RepID=UPI000B959701|nr:UDP-N-acetylmuramoyl-tripeptide--D-alanyl-D-alanine ligase [Coxiella burnetii]OYK79453.1 UDP-N-acetylmuramoyl-tripeptide--D-alanyl-D-alanine ligase [Coxiella burnetii]